MTFQAPILNVEVPQNAWLDSNKRIDGSESVPAVGQSCQDVSRRRERCRFIAAMAAPGQVGATDGGRSAGYLMIWQKAWNGPSGVERRRTLQPSGNVARFTSLQIRPFAAERATLPAGTRDGGRHGRCCPLLIFVCLRYWGAKGEKETLWRCQDN